MPGPRLTASLLPALLLLLPAGAGAQGSPLSLSVRAGGASPSGSFSPPVTVQGEVGGGTSFGVHFQYRRGPATNFYVGFTQHRFGCGEMDCSGGGEYVHTGWDVGARFDLTGGPVRPWVRLGGVFARVERGFELEGRSGEGLSDLSAGAEAGLGLAVPLPGRLRAEAGGRYVWMNTVFPGEGLMRMRFFVTDLGLVVGF